MQKYHLDFHIHSKYSRAVSQNMDLEHLEESAKKKGIEIVGTGDFTHPEWFKELKSKLKKIGPGVYKLNLDSPINFIISGEISCIYSKGGRVYRIHVVILPSSIEAAEKINLAISWIGNVKSDGRPILGIDVIKLCELIWQKDPEALIIPAHIWTPWFSLYGSASGFDSIRDAFGQYVSRIYALETGLSSDPEMNWRVKEIREKVLVSNSDAHSPDNLGRELTVLETNGDFSFPLFSQILHEGYQSKMGKIYTVEFYPEEGKYHYDGHRNCKVSLSPQESKKINDICPVCNKKLTIGVLNRVNKLADSKEPVVPVGASFLYAIPLRELISQIEGVGAASKKVKDEYEKVVNQVPEIEFLLYADKDKLMSIGGENLALAVLAMRQNEVEKIPGFDGQFGKITVKINLKKEEQARLF